MTEHSLHSFLWWSKSSFYDFMFIYFSVCSCLSVQCTHQVKFLLRHRAYLSLSLLLGWAIHRFENLTAFTPCIKIGSISTYIIWVLKDLILPLQLTFLMYSLFLPLVEISDLLLLCVNNSRL